MSTALSKASGALALFNPAPFNERLDAITARRSVFTEAIARGRIRLAEIERDIHKLREGDDGLAAAEELLAGDAAVRTRTIGVDALMAERDDIRAALRRLSDQERECEGDIAEVRSDARIAVRDHTDNIQQSLEAEMQSAVDALLSLYAKTIALEWSYTATTGGISHDLQTMARAAGHKWQKRQSIDVPKDALDFLRSASPIVKLMGGTIPTTIISPFYAGYDRRA